MVWHFEFIDTSWGNLAYGLKLTVSKSELKKKFLRQPYSCILGGFGNTASCCTCRPLVGVSTMALTDAPVQLQRLSLRVCNIFLRREFTFIIGFSLSSYPVSKEYL